MIRRPRLAFAAVLTTTLVIGATALWHRQTTQRSAPAPAVAETPDGVAPTAGPGERPSRPEAESGPLAERAEGLLETARAPRPAGRADDLVTRAERRIQGVEARLAELGVRPEAPPARPPTAAQRRVVELQGRLDALRH